MEKEIIIMKNLQHKDGMYFVKLILWLALAIAFVVAVMNIIDKPTVKRTEEDVTNSFIFNGDTITILNGKVVNN